MRATFGNASSTRFFFPFEKKKKIEKTTTYAKKYSSSRLASRNRNSSRELLISRKFNKRQRGTRENE